MTGNGGPREWREREIYRRSGDRDWKEFSISFHFFLSFLLFLLYSSLAVVARIRERVVDKIFQRFPSSGYWNSSEDQASSGSLKRKDRMHTMIGSGLCFTIVLQIMKYWIIKMLSINKWLYIEEAKDTLKTKLSGKTHPLETVHLIQALLWFRRSS